MDAPPSTKDLILRQVEFYLSDQTWTSDDYLNTLKRESDSAIAVAELNKFPRLAKLTAGDDAVLASAIEGSDSLYIIDENTFVKRRFASPDVDEAASRSIHVTGFPKGAGEDAVKAAFSKYGGVESVRLLRNLNQDARPLDGSAFVRFEEDTGASTASAAGTGGMLAHAGSMLIVKPMPEWFANIQKEILRRKEGGAKTKSEGGAEKSKKRDRDEPPKIIELTVLEGAVLHLQGLPEGAAREDINSAVAEFGEIKYVEYQRGESSGYVRFGVAGAAVSAAAALAAAVEGERTIAGTKVTAISLAGDDEAAYWTKTREALQGAVNSRAGGKGGKGKGKGRGRGKGGGGGRGGGKFQKR